MQKMSHRFKHHVVTQYWPFALIVVLVTTFYHNALFNGLIGDDVDAIMTNTHAGDFVYNLRMNGPQLWIMLRTLTFTLFQYNSLAYHAVNIIIHICTTCAIYLFAKKLTDKKVAAITAALFALHPMLSEGVTWISGGIYSFYTLFTILALYFYAERKKHHVYFFVSLAMAIAALLSSEKAVVLPLLVLLYTFTFEKKKSIRSTIPYFVLDFFAVIYAFIRFQGRINSIQTFSPGGFDMRAYLLQLPTAFIGYIKLLLWPLHLTFYHTEPLTRLDYVLYAALTLLFFAIIIVTYIKKQKILFFGLSFFTLSLSLMVSPLPIASYLAERYVYLGSFGILLSFAYLFVRLVLNRWQRLGLLIIFVVILLLGIRTYIRNKDWNDRNFWKATVAESPYSFQAHNSLGLVYLHDKKYKEATKEFQRTIDLAPNFAEAYENIGYALQLNKQLQQSEYYYMIALKLNPQMWKVYKNLGGLYLSYKDYDKAIAFAQRAIELHPNDPELYTNLGIIYFEMRDDTTAHASFQKALQIDPQYQKAALGLRITAK